MDSGTLKSLVHVQLYLALAITRSVLVVPSREPVRSGTSEILGQANVPKSHRPLIVLVLPA